MYSCTENRSVIKQEIVYAYWLHTHDADDHQYHMLHITFIT